MRETIKKVCNILAIDLNESLMKDLIEELQGINDYQEFISYCKLRFNYEKYRYLKPYPKFIELVNDFRREYQPKLNADEKLIVGKYADRLFNKVCNCFDEVNFMVQEGIGLHSDKMDKYILSCFSSKDLDKDLKVLKSIGKRDVLLSYMSKKEILRDKIEKRVMSLTLEKKYPQIAMKSKEQLLLEKLGK